MTIKTGRDNCIFKIKLETVYISAVGKRFAFVGKKTGDELERLGVKTIGQLAKYDEHILVRHFGKAGNMLYRYANGLDSEPVKSIYEKEKVKSVGNGMTFRQDLVGEEDVRSGIYALSTVLRHVYAEKYEMHDSANIDKRSAI